MNLMEENLPVAAAQALSDVSTARKRRRQKRLKPLKTPDRLSDVQLNELLEKTPASPLWTLSPAGSNRLEGVADQEDNISSISHTPRDLQQPVADVILTDYVGEVHRKTPVEDEIIETTASTEFLSPPDQGKQAKAKKEKRKKSKDRGSRNKEQDITSNAITISAALNDIIDSVEVINETRPTKPRTSLTSGRGSEISLISDGKVFVQHGHNFIPVAREKAFCQSTPRDNSASQHSSTGTALSMAIDYQKHFLPLSTMCHGLLAGMAIWQCIMVFLQNGKDDTLTFIENYSNVARIFQAMFYVLSTVSCIAVLDRCIPSSFSLHVIWDLLILQPCCLLALVAGCGALISSSIAAKLDDRLALRAYNETLWTDSMESDEYMSEWLTTNLVRCVLAVVSYLIISICWGDNSSALPFPEVSTSVKPA